ncbi:hypothetical protein JCM15519_21360 [Fundidesulfovibrio butyratiphilus]
MLTDIERVKLEFVTNLVSLEISTVFKDLYDLMHRRSLIGFLKKDTPGALEEVKKSYLKFSEDNHQYDQIRLLSKQGQEMLRINSKDGRAWAVPPAELQSKADRYYFVDSVDLPPGGIYTSPLDLNIEYGQLEIPHKPMLRVATPLRNDSGEVVAVLVLNYLGDVLLKTLHNRLEFADQTVMLLNADGYWLDGGDEHDWAFMFPERGGQTFAALHPDLWRSISSTPAGQVTGPDGLYTFATIDLTPDKLPGGNHHRGSVPPAFRQTWKVVSLTPNAVLSRVRWKQWPLYCTGVSLILLLSALGAHLHASRMLERQAAERALRASEARFRGLVETSPDLIWETDTTGVFTYASPRSTSLLGLPPERLVGMSVCPFLPPAGDAPDGNSPLTWEMSCSGESKIQKELEINSVPMLDENGFAIGRRGVARDVTERKNAQRLLDDARREAVRANQAKSEFLARMSHEIRTPLNAVIGMAYLALKTELTAKQADYVNKIRVSADSLLAVINDILDYSKIEAGRFSIERIPFDLDAVLGNVVDIMGPGAEEKHLELLLSVGGDVPSGLVGDPLRLGQVLLNLVGNAIKFTDSGEVLLAVSLEEAKEESVRLRLAVRDTGIGLTPEQKEHLFSPFSQADESISRRYGGTGLGLSICFRLVELMGGTLEVQSVAGQGSEFFYSLEFPLSPKATPLCQENTENLAGMGVLVVDDNITSRQILKDLLLSMRFTVTTAESGAAALRVLEQGETDIRIVLLDWKMPGMDGATCARHIRSMPLSRRPAIIMVTAFGREEVRRDAENVGVDGFLLKPVGRSVLFNAIASAVGLASKAQPCTPRPDDAFADEAERLFAVRGARILLVEDNEINQQVALELLDGAGLSVAVADDGAKALDMLETEPFAAVLMDVQMPVMDGLEATRRIRENPRFAALPIIAMTAHAMEQDRKESLQAGMNDHIGKPINPGELYTTLARWLLPRGAEPVPPAREEAEEPHVPAPEATPEMPYLDTRLGLSRIRGNHALYRKLLSEFPEKFSEIATTITERLTEGDTTGARRLAHTLKGVAGNIGAMALYATSAEVETCIVDRPNHCAVLIGRLGRELATTQEAIAAHLEASAQPQPEPGAGNALSADALIDLVDALLALLAQNDTKALDVFETLAPGSRRIAPELVEAVSQSLRKFNFTAAKTDTFKLRERLAAHAPGGDDARNA